MLSDFKPLLKNKDFCYLWISQIFSQLSINVMNFLLLITMFNKTSSSTSTSFLWIIYAIPAILVGPIGAAYVDMVDRRKILIFSNLAQSVTILLYALSNNTSFYLIFMVALMYSFFNQFYVPAEFASLPSLVKKKQYPLANGLFFLTQQGSLVVGFSIAGLIMGKIGYTNSLLACSAFLFVAFLSVMRLPTIASKEFKGNFREAVEMFFKQILEGSNFIRHKPRVLTAFLTLMALQIATAVVVVTAPALAGEIFQIDASFAGIFVAAPAGIGALVGAVVVSRLLVRRWRKITSINFFLFLMGISLLMLATIIPQLSDNVRLSTGVVMIVLCGISFVGLFIPFQTYLQEEVPGGLRGRVFGNFWFLVTIATIFPVLFSGVITDLVGVKIVYIILGIFALFGWVGVRKFGHSFIMNKLMKKK